MKEKKRTRRTPAQMAEAKAIEEAKALEQEGISDTESGGVENEPSLVDLPPITIESEGVPDSSHPDYDEDAEIANPESCSPTVVEPEISGSLVDSFVFIGNGRDDPRYITMYGREFELNGKPVEIEELAICDRISRNNHFKRV